MELQNLIPIAAILVAAVVLVIVLRRFMRSRLRGEPGHRRERAAQGAPSRAAPLASEDQEYLDSSHIISGSSAGRQDPPR